MGEQLMHGIPVFRPTRKQFDDFPSGSFSLGVIAGVYTSGKKNRLAGCEGFGGKSEIDQITRTERHTRHDKHIGSGGHDRCLPVTGAPYG